MIRMGIAKLKQVNTINMEELEKKSKKIRTSLLKEKRKERENEIRSRMENSQFSNEPKPIDTKLLETLIQEKIREEEKTVKRKAAENIYNNYEKHIEFCNDLFKFD